MRRFLLFILLSTGSIAMAQEYANTVTRRYAVASLIQVDTVSINPTYFIVRNTDNKLVSEDRYDIAFAKAQLSIPNTTLIATDSIDISYLPFPNFLTQVYRTYDPAIILDNTSRTEQLTALKKPTVKRNFIPFNGLETSGSITRGVRVGNNQNSVVDSELDLRITGKLNDKVSLRASIQDANVPQTQNGYSQRLDEFDQIFIELFSDNWSIRAGDVDLQQDDFQFNRFTKRVQGISGRIAFQGENSSSYATVAGALVRGTFNISRFTGQEGNQGPYKLTGQNGELFILVVSGSERVFVNGVPLTRGENADYVIDYNAGEVRFTPTFPITSEMRISIEYQFSERNFTRFVGYTSGGYKRKNFNIEAYAYTETDAKNQPLQQNLSEEQVAALAAAGDDPSLAFASSAVQDELSANQILYRREIIGGVERFVFSQDPTVTLFNVRFTNVGAGQGNYRLIDDQAIANIYEFIAPIAGVPQGDFEPIIRLFAPEILTIAGAKSQFTIANSTTVATELSVSNNDLNKFSSIDDDDNTGLAARILVNQNLLPRDSLNTLSIDLGTDYVQRDFRNVERVYNIEFNRDWNLLRTDGDQRYTTAAINYSRDSTLQSRYEYQNLAFDDFYNGNRHQLVGSLNKSGWESRFRGSVLNTNTTDRKTAFLRANAAVLKRFSKNYAGARFSAEDLQDKDKTTGDLNALSQRFSSYEVYAGRGDSTATYVEVGYRRRINDSVRDGSLDRVNRSSDYYIRAQPIKNKVSQLRIFANYRELEDATGNGNNQTSLNSRLVYQHKFFNNKIISNTAYETNSATIPRQDFTYIEVNPGQGTFTWIDYNEDGIQDLNEFEIAQFQDQAQYVRILLPNQIFIPTHKNTFSQTLTLNPIPWNNETGIKKLLSKFYNQTSYLIERMIERDGDDFDLNPFNESDEQLGLNLSFRNSLFFNRGKQKFTTNYTYISTETENLQSIGSLSSEIESHQITFLHKIASSWLVTLNGQAGFNASASENFTNRNFKIEDQLIRPQISYLFNQSNRIDLFFEYQHKDNVINEPALLDQRNLGVTWSFNKAQKFAINGELRYVDNSFNGQAFSPVGFQMLEGLQPGNNVTWNLLFQKNITSFLDINLSYNGRSTSNAPTVHNGSIQLKAFF